jgi:hydroxymethylpyrimidine/phosphomethylpyrimidine kinase
MKKALTIAGSDPTGGAGLQTDLKVFHAIGVYGLSAVSSLTAQSSCGVEGVMPVGGRFLKKQLDVLLADLRPDAAKTGMLYTEENIEIVVAMLRKYAVKNVVVDPVFLSTTGRRLASKGLPAVMKKRLLPLCDIVTPNLHEASVFAGIPVRSKGEMEEAARRIADYGAGAVVVTGGHLEGTTLDVLYCGRFYYFRSEKKPGEYHGTGCAFSAALAAFLALGHGMPEAVRRAKRFIGRALAKSFAPGRGMRLLGL